ncbi:(ABC) transporter [Coemansia sp. RSA 2399]|nr:(ABC) transporter [Coemansia sp. RSA 2399]KAJ1901953.1 (ABC) transporter [Coemansia sp. IMI 209127]
MEPLSSVALPDYINSGSQYEIEIHKIPTDENPDETPASFEQASEIDVKQFSELDARIDEILQSPNKLEPDAGTQEANSEYAGFNLDNILDLMAGDESGNVDFGAIGFELANNLANVVDMNEVGSFATTFGLMMSGIGTAAEIQRQRGGASDLAALQNNVIPNPVLNSGISALIGQVLAAQQAGSSGGSNYNAANNALNLDGLDMARLLESVAGGSGSAIDVDIHNIANVVDSLLGDVPTHNTKTNAEAGSSKKAANVPGPSDSVSSSADGKSGPRNAASALNDFINGNDTSNISDIAQAIGIRNFFKVEEKVIPDGCPSCFNCLYPGSTCTHNATCNQFTGRCNCPSGWTGEDCLLPGK